MRKFITDLIDKVSSTPASKIVVNGHSVVGRNVTVLNGKVIVDGKKVDIPDAKEIIINIEGDLGSLQIDAGDVTVQGSTGDITSGAGNVIVGQDVKGSIKVEAGNVDCKDVYSDIKVDMGNIRASTIHGDAKTGMGNISK